jgi:hypothetical protein
LRIQSTLFIRQDARTHFDNNRVSSRSYFLSDNVIHDFIYGYAWF